MNFVKTFWHEITLAAVAVWGAIGTDGQSGLLNLAATEIHHWPKLVSTVAVSSVILARLRTSPMVPPAAGN